jgi:hypothetical protein
MSKVKTSNVRVKQGDGRVAELLVAVYSAVKNQDINLGDINIDLDDVENLLQGIGGSEEAPAIVNTVTAGSVVAGTFSVSFYNKGTTDATVLGAPLVPGATLELCAKTGNTLGAIAYIASATSELQIITTSI